MEFALIFPILILLLVAIFDVGRLVFAYNDITNAARAGARVAIVNQGSNVAQQATIGQATSLGLTNADVTVTYLQPNLGAACPSPYDLGCVAEVTRYLRLAGHHADHRQHHRTRDHHHRVPDAHRAGVPVTGERLHHLTHFRGSTSMPRTDKRVTRARPSSSWSSRCSPSSRASA